MAYLTPDLRKTQHAYNEHKLIREIRVIRLIRDSNVFPGISFASLHFIQGKLSRLRVILALHGE
jgi:hypothetical protein